MNFLYLLKIAIIHLLCFNLPSSSAIIHQNGNETDRQALLEFKSKITNDPFGVLNSWNSTSHFCQWYGVKCERKRVTSLILFSSKLSGSISPYIGNLSFLRVLFLQNNSFTHEIPREISHLYRLEWFSVSNNSIGGEIPTIIFSNCSNLLAFGVSYNKMVGKIPYEVGSLFKLKYLILSSNNFIGTLPPSLGNLSSLEDLFASENHLHGNLPHTLGKLKNLKIFGIDENQFSGTIPSSIYNISSIEAIDVKSNNLKGNLPTNFPNLYFFSVGHNQYSGTIPSSISNASNLQTFQLQFNYFRGAVPSFEKLQALSFLNIAANHLGSSATNSDDLMFLSSLTNATMLRYLVISQNRFNGKLPLEIGNLSKSLLFLDVGHNQISGNIPTEIFFIASLQGLWLGSNRFWGTIPYLIGRLQNLLELSLENNEFTGIVPSSIENLTNLFEIDLSNNNFWGIIPSSLGNCKMLGYIHLGRNNLSGSIPSKLFQLSSSLIYFGSSENRLGGPIPDEVGNMKNLQVLDLSDNMLSGNVPASLGSCVTLESLNLSRNNFEGPIPSSLNSLRNIVDLNISHNNLSGKIPKFLEEFQLIKILDLSYNDFEGLVPIKGPFNNASVTSIAGSERLCGGIPNFGLPACDNKKPNKWMTMKLKIIISSISTVVSVALMVTCVFLCYSRKKKRGLSSDSFHNVLLNASYQSLLKATNGFSSENLIGTGSFGSVYKGLLDTDRIVVAVKVLNLEQQGASKSFLTECAAIRNIRHRNLVQVLTACSSVDYHGNDFKALVYEFMSNGSLDDWLHPIIKPEEEARTLNVRQRLDIAIDVAYALEYLHLHCGTPIVHCDLKPNNILLDEEMIAHVSDFGLVKFLSDDMIDFTKEISSQGLKGTFGYCPPEYGAGSKVSILGDIFSFGILLLEMFTGKRPTDEMFDESLNLHNFVKEALPDNVMQVIDRDLLQIQDATLTGRLISIMEIGISCSVEIPQERMKINDVVALLSSLRKKLSVSHAI